MSYYNNRRVTGYSRNQYGPQPPRKMKRSGAVRGVDKNGNEYIRGWKATRAGMITYFATPYKNSKRWKTPKGKEFESWICNITNCQTGETSVAPCVHNKQTDGVLLNDSQIYLSPRGGVGGYTGSIVKKKKRY